MESFAVPSAVFPNILMILYHASQTISSTFVKKFLFYDSRKTALTKTSVCGKMKNNQLSGEKLA